ncbi:MAG: alpha/beta hydrolase [Anaerolineae bacterium]|jgi:pimeloyl-ACP methyl ester carboxylesterase|nr:alpha/beta hydrolase [Anaerolineae bacterium]
MPFAEIGELKIYYDRIGSGEPLVLFPDNLLASSAYQREIDHFATSFEVIAFDYPGRGKSTHATFYPDEQELDLWGFWADMACHLLQTLNLDHAYAVGIGGGAMAALHFAGNQAHQHHLKVCGVIADSFLADWDARTLHRWLDVREHYYVRNQPLLETLHGKNWRTLMDQDTDFIRRLADHGGYQVPDAFMNAITCPVLLTGHQQDHTLPNIAREYARISQLIPNCDLYLSAQRNHPFIERPYAASDSTMFLTMADLFFAKIRN